ncbi:cytochrome P450 [Gymnopilus junonius]|uniref:Cytochrome P450 n=1 Tax=Gymnopilus junonius TaxID=109634 RepID=A0A9P5NWZ1_GYMJU|nr:cytochrome P450 [Gymnopilus junonius]
MNLDTSTALPALTALLAVYLAWKWVNSTTYKLRHIPTVGSSGIISSYFDAFRFFRHAHEIIHEGYTKFPGSAFKVPTISRWTVVVSGQQMIDDIKRATDDQMSFEEAVAETIQTDYTLGHQVRVDHYHIPIVRTPLTRNIAIRFSDIKDEISTAFSELIPAKEDEWMSLPALPTIMKVVCRTSNRLFVGLPLCRNPDYRQLNEQFTIDVIVGAQIINMFPNLVKPIVGRILTKVPASIKRAVSHLQPLIEEQLEQEEKYGKDRPDKPNNLVSWLLDEAKGPQRNIDDLAIRVLTINFAAIHTTTNALTHVLYNLAAHPEYAAPMREEVEAVIEVEGLNKLSMTKMRKVDSFIKESQRLAIGGVSMNRKILKDFTFSNGITLPAGTIVAVATYSTHMDDQNYDSAREFQGFRFANLRDEDGEGLKHQFVALEQNFLTFGGGRHACPGRFFAANELKAMLAYVLLNYDIKFPDDGPRPQDVWIQAVASPNRKAEVMFKKRKSTNFV